MNKLLLILLLPLSLFAQRVQPKIALDLIPGEYHIKVQNPMNNSVFSIDHGDFRARVGVEAFYKQFSVYFDQHIYMDYASAQFDPTQAYWFAGTKWRNKKFEIKYEHTCIHPINTYSNQYRARYFGGWDMVSFSYGY